MDKKELDEKYSYQIDERNVVHLFRGEESCQQYLTNPLLSAIFKIENLEKENAELKKQVEQKQHLADVRCEQSIENYKLFSDERKKRIDTDIALEDMTDNLTKAKEIIKDLCGMVRELNKPNVQLTNVDYSLSEAEQFLKDN